MDKLKRVIKVLTVLLVIWLGFTFYFITQHTVVGKEGKINKTVVFDDLTIELDRMVFYNFKRKAIDFDTNESSKYKYILLSNLPKSLIEPYLRIKFLYSTPYEIDNKFYQTALFGKCIFTQHFNEEPEYYEYFRDHVSISVVDSAGADYSRGRSTSHEANSQETDFSIRGRDFPIERLQGGMKVIIKHLVSGEEREFDIDFQDFIIYEHNDSFGKPFPFHL